MANRRSKRNAERIEDAEMQDAERRKEWSFMRVGVMGKRDSKQMIGLYTSASLFKQEAF